MAARARKIIVANWIDVSLIRVRVTRGIIHLQGRAQKLSAPSGEENGTEAGMRKLDDDLRMVPNLRGVTYMFDNWMRDDTGGWRLQGQKKGKSLKFKG